MSLSEQVAAAADAKPYDEGILQAALAGVASAFASLGRVFFCSDASFHVLHASSNLDRMVGPGASARAQGRPLSDLLGSELFGPAGTLRQLLLAGERREGWRSLAVGAGLRAAARVGDGRALPPGAWRRAATRGSRS